MKRFGISLRKKLMMRSAIALVAGSAGATWCLLAMSNAGPVNGPAPDALAATPYVDITSSGPLSHIWLGNDLSCQVQHVLDGTVHEFYPDDAIPGDCGTFIAMDGVLYAPDFSAHDTTSTDSIGMRTVFTPVSQSAVTGSGTAVDPYKVVTVVAVTGTALVIEQTDTYIVGDEHYKTDLKIINDGLTTASGVLYRAGDAFLAGSDSGFGFTEVFNGSRQAVGCAVNENNVPPGKIEEWIPLTGGNNYYQNFYDDVWLAIGSQMPFPDTCSCSDSLDNGAGISWNFSIPAGGSATYSHVITISPGGSEGLVTSKSADTSASDAATQNGYTITIQNPNISAVTLSSCTDTLPSGFAYVPGSTTGATTNDPAIAGQMLTWSGSFTVSAHDSISLHFGVTVADMPGEYFNEASGTVEGGFTIIATGPTAKITVAAGTPSPTPTASPTATESPSPTPTGTPMANPTATATATSTPTATATATATPTATATATATPTATATATATPTATATATATP